MTASTQRPPHGPEEEAPADTVFADPVAYLRQLGIDSTLVEEIADTRRIPTMQSRPQAA